MHRAIQSSILRAIQLASSMPSGHELADYLYAFWYSGWQSYPAFVHGESGSSARLLQAYQAIDRDFSLAAMSRSCAAPGMAMDRDLVPRGWPDTERGYWFVSSLPEASSFTTNLSLRLYWNTSAEGAPFLLSTLQLALFQAQTSFQLKLPLAQHDFNRFDSCVLYLPMEAFGHVRRLLLYSYKTLAPCLRPHTPALARPLAPGLALAESPATCESFGTHRCRLMALGLSLCSRSDPFPVQLRRIMEQLLAAGISPSTPHLNTFKADYPW